jgi:hypothetical protein
VWVNGLADSRAELQCVSRHARLYSQLLGRISSATKKMDSKIVSLANSILEKGHPKNSFNFKGLVQWSFIEKLYTTKSTEAKKLIQSFSGSASNRMRVIVVSRIICSRRLEFPTSLFALKCFAALVLM